MEGPGMTSSTLTSHLESAIRLPLCASMPGLQGWRCDRCTAHLSHNASNSPDHSLFTWGLIAASKRVIVTTACSSRLRLFGRAGGKGTEGRSLPTGSDNPQVFDTCK